MIEDDQATVFLQCVSEDMPYFRAFRRLHAAGQPARQTAIWSFWCSPSSPRKIFLLSGAGACSRTNAMASRVFPCRRRPSRNTPVARHVRLQRRQLGLTPDQLPSHAWQGAVD